ncbi:Down syndrome cell adhesion molecule-like protein Dscam2 [Stegodyphus dumicola]|uniref:Down syndrome cell adhesion molecule-like protein Dscam2 n=1 Tax=Stegodyphus dumicola TaxID=202533 RepID=UPI0015B06E5E|nr:Down syndrome cell adhesion molecule-like protein Dscam2 [Stegodyphus dumicola]
MGIVLSESFIILICCFVISSSGDAPVVASFAFPSALREGERGSATCTIRSGDRPLEFQWLKNGEELKETSNVEIQSIKDTSILLIESVTSESSGNYTCIVKNAYGTDRFTASLYVSAPPTWIKEPMDVLVQEGESLTVECVATGVPQPTITWTTDKEVGSQISSDPLSVIRTSPSGSLIISKVDASMQGSYNCKAGNGFGKALKKSIKVSVQGKKTMRIYKRVLSWNHIICHIFRYDDVFLLRIAKSIFVLA